jgi:2-polyprenyl-3-methyl-5-hydroxy-6-metoxy-1,4-benzoquinol methylase
VWRIARERGRHHRNVRRPDHRRADRHPRRDLARAAQLEVEDVAGLAYDPFQNSARQSTDVDVNYMMHLRRSGDSE